MKSCLRVLSLFALCSLASVLVGCASDCGGVGCSYGEGSTQLVLRLEEHGEPFNRTPFSGTLTLLEFDGTQRTLDITCGDNFEATEDYRCDGYSSAIVLDDPDERIVEVYASLATDDGRRVDATRAVDYETFHPNGPDCGTGCRFTIVTLAFE